MVNHVYDHSIGCAYTSTTSYPNQRMKSMVHLVTYTTNNNSEKKFDQKICIKCTWFSRP